MLKKLYPIKNLIFEENRMAKQATEITTAREALLAFCQSLEMERRLLQFITGSAATGRAKSVRHQLGEVRKEPLRDTQAGIRRRLQAFVCEGLGREFSQQEEELLTAILTSREFASEWGSYLQEKARGKSGNNKIARLGIRTRQPLRVK